MQEDIDKDEVSLKEIFNLLAGYIKDVKKNYKIILLVGLLVASLLALKTWIEPPMYEETLTFMMDDSAGNDAPTGGLQVLGDLFGGGKGKNNLEKILRLFESKKIINNTLFDTISIDGHRDYLVNHYLDKYTVDAMADSYKSFGFVFNEDWPKKVLADPNYRFVHSNIDSLSDSEILFLRIVTENIVGNPNVGIDTKLSSAMDDESGIMTLTMYSEHPELTLGVLQNIYKQLSQFFIDKSTEKQKKTYGIMKEKRDSIFTTLKSAEYRLASFKDKSRKLVTVRGYLNQLEYEREVTILNLMYAEVTKQLEATDFALRNKTPVVQIIDLPRTPINPQKGSKLKSFIVGFLIGCFLAVIYFIGKKIAEEVLGT